MKNYEFLNDIKNSSQNGKLTFFIGAGVSRLSEYPSWKGLINVLSEKIGLPIKGETEDYSSNEYLAIPQKYFYSINQNTDEYYKIIMECLDKDKEPNEVHDIILALKPANIITTNYDNLIEKAVAKHGLFYSVVSSDSSIGVENSEKLILKIHGDFKNKNIILKEEDYLNYSENFRLIETIVKSIFATNTVVFVGYALEDYNVKLILNWVKNLQGENFKTPYFLYLDNKNLSDLDMTYYKSRGVEIIDFRDFSTEKPEMLSYLQRYELILRNILEFKKSDVGANGKQLDYLYDLLKPLNKLNTLRIIDVRKKLEEDYTIDNFGCIHRKNENADYFEEFIKIHNEYKDTPIEKINNELISKCSLIENVLKKAKILYYNGRPLGFKCTKVNNNYTESLDIDKMKNYIELEYDDNYCNYIKAYYYFKLGYLKESFELYTTVAQIYFEQKELLYYYLAQVNRYMVFNTINMMNRYYQNPISSLWQVKPEFIEIDSGFNDIMQKINIDDIFDNLPNTLKEKYSTLKNLFNSNELYRNMFNMYSKVKKVKRNVQYKTIEFSNKTKLDDVISMLNENIDFIYGNYLIVDDYNEYKEFVKESIEAILLTYSDSMNNYIMTATIYKMREPSKIALDSREFSCMVKYFKSDDLRELFEKYNLRCLQFTDFDNCFRIVKNIFDYALSDDNNVQAYFFYKVENYIKNIIEICKHVELNKEEYQYIVTRLFNIGMNIGDKILFLDKQQTYNKKIKGSIHQILEDILNDYLFKKFNNTLLDGEELSLNGLFYIDIVDHIVDDNSNYKSYKISRLVKHIIDKKISIDFSILIKLSPILTKDILEEVLSIIKKQQQYEFKPHIFQLLVQYNLISNIIEYESEIINYLETNVIKLSNLTNKRITSYDINFNGDFIPAGTNELNKFLENIGFWCLEEKLKNDTFLKYKGINNQFDFFIDLDNYDYSKFETKWIINFNVETHKKLVQNITAHKQLKTIMIEYLKDKNFNGKQKSKILELYLDVYDK